MKTLAKPDFEALIDGLIDDDPRSVVGPQRRNGQYVFGELDSAGDLALEYDLTVLSPKKYLLPQYEQLLTYERTDGEYEMHAGTDTEGVIIVGVHPYDLAAIEHLDKVHIDTMGDEPYRKRREDSLLIGLTMQSVAPESFAASMGTATTNSGYDLLVTDIGGQFVVDIGSFEGNELLADLDTRSATHSEVQEVRRIEDDLQGRFERELQFPPEELPTLLSEHYDDMAFWESYAEQCLSCGSCNMVCPTCYCFQVETVRDLGGDSGQQQRRWDGCLLEEFASVAQGENFREEIAQRHRHRFMRKGLYVYERYGDVSCVGCGRCTRHCVADVADPTEVYNDLWEATNA